MQPPDGHECISDGAMASYLDGHGDVHERETVTKHIAVCSDCYEAWLVAKQLRQAPAQPKRPVRRLLWLVVAGAGMLSVALLSLFSGGIRERGRTFFYEYRLGIRGIVQQATALRYRAVPPRLVGFPHRPLALEFRGAPGEVTETPRWRLRGAPGTLQQSDSATADSYHGQGVTALTLGEIDRAEIALEHAVTKE